MKAAKTWLVGLSGLITVTLTLVPAGRAWAALPYIKTYGADVSVGGWFDSSTAGCVGSGYYQDPAYGATKSSFTGGILTWAKHSGNNAAGGSSSQYGSFALGSIDNGGDGTSGSQDGFYSDGANAGKVDQLSFSDISSLPSTMANAWGGGFDYDSSSGGYTPLQSQCIFDYFDTFRQGANTTAIIGNSLGDADSLRSNNYYAESGAGTFTLGSSTISANKNIGLIIKGNVYISGNITYASHDASNVPKFALVVLGNIYIDPSVTRLDGWYIAQPDMTNAANVAATGNIWTCASANQGTNIDYTVLLSGPCHDNKLTINGAVTAKQLFLLRTRGDLASADTGEDSSSAASGGAAEVVNFSPEMVMNGPFFNQKPGTPSVQSLVTLPPVF